MNTDLVSGDILNNEEKENCMFYNRFRLSAVPIAFSILLVAPAIVLSQTQDAFLTGEVLVRFNMDVQKNTLPSELIAAGMSFVRSTALPRLVVLKPENTEEDVLDIVETIQQLPYVEYAEPNIIFFFTETWTPDDDHYADPPGSDEGQWYLRSTEDYSTDASIARKNANGSRRMI